MQNIAIQHVKKYIDWFFLEIFKRIIIKVLKKSKAKKGKGKRQPALPTLERPCIEVLDDAIAELVDAEHQLKEWKAKRDECKQVVDGHMIELEKKLEKDEDGDRVYLFVDGEMRHLATLPQEDQKRHAKVTSKRVPRSELEDE